MNIIDLKGTAKQNENGWFIQVVPLSKFCLCAKMWVNFRKVLHGSSTSLGKNPDFFAIRRKILLIQISKKVYLSGEKELFLE